MKSNEFPAIAANVSNTRNSIFKFQKQTKQNAHTKIIKLIFMLKKLLAFPNYLL